jgi:uncharacterized protein YbjT (DUF2867 family)
MLCARLATRVVQLSALGSHPDAATGYWRSKGAEDADLLARDLQVTVIRPSLVYGDEGASSVMFRALATLPLLLLPMAQEALVHPIHVDDLVAIIVRLLDMREAPCELAAVGPRAMSMAAYLAELRAGMLAAPAFVMQLPMPMARLVARVAACAPSSALTPESLRMLELSARSSPSARAGAIAIADDGITADAGSVAALLGRPLRDSARFAQPAQRIGAVWSWAAPLITLAMAALWLWTAFVSWFAWPHAESRAWLNACGVPLAAQEATLLAASLTDAAIGLLLLLRPRRWLWALQLALVGGYTLAMSFFLPDFWLHPFGPLSKNLPLLALMFLMWRASK